MAISSSPAAGSARRGSLRPALWPASAALLVGLWHLAAASRLTAPIIMADEYGYLGAARRIVGDVGQTHVPYHAGAGLLYVPAALLGDGPLGVYRGALVTNAVLAALLALAAWWAAGLFEPLRRPPVRFAATCAVGLYTSFVGYSGLAAPEVAFAALELALLPVFARALRRGRPFWWALASTGCAAAWLLHPRGAGVIAAGLVVAFVALRPARLHWPAITAFLSPFVVGLPLITWLDDWVSGTVLDPEQYDSGAIVSDLAGGHGLKMLVITAFGQFFYLNAATLGLVTLGGLALWRRLRSTVDDRLVALYPLAAMAFVFAISVATNARSSRADHLLYGRYNEGAIAPLLLAGFAVLAGTEAVALRRLYVATAGGVTLAAAAVFYGLAGSGRLHGIYFLVTVLGIDPVRRRIGWPDPLLIAAAVFVLIFLVAEVRRFGRVAPIALVAVVFMVFGVKNTRDFFQPESRNRSEEHVLADALNRIGAQEPLACVAYDKTAESFFHHFNYQYLAPARYVLFVPGQAPPCGDVVISNAAFGGANPGARALAIETRAPQVLWVLPGPRQDRLAAAGAFPGG